MSEHDMGLGADWCDALELPTNLMYAVHRWIM